MQVPAFGYFGLKSDYNNYKGVKHPAKTDYINICFWESFNDPILVHYIQKALENNHDLKKASWKVEQYRQEVRLSLGKELPRLSMGANYLGLKVTPADNFTINRNAFILPFIASYEPDFLLKNRDKTRATKKTYEAVQFEEQAIYISLVGDIASVYINIMKFDKMIELQEKIYKNQKEIHRRSKNEYSQGIISKTELNKTAQNEDTAKSDLEELLKSRQTLLNQFCTLIAESPNNADKLKRADFYSFGLGIVPPDMISSDVIFSRPDVLEREKNLEKGKIDVRVARKEFLPSFNVFGALVFNTIGHGNFFSWDSLFATLLAGASQNIFMGGQKVASLKINKAKYEQLFEDYKQTDLIALKEVNDALFLLKHDFEIQKAALAKAELEQNNFNQTKNRYKNGTISYPELLFEENNLHIIQQNFIDKKTARLIDYVTLYKAVGGQL